jgi:hypothetical protein
MSVTALRSRLRRAIPAILVLVLLPSACTARSDSESESTSVQVTILAFADIDDPASGTFTAQGPAVDLGRLCSGGSWTNVGFDFSTTDANWFEDEMTCDDGTGSFVLRVGDLGTPTASEPWTGPWVVVSGTGGYTDLGGRGSFAADFSGDSGVETYVGTIESD